MTVVSQLVAGLGNQLFQYASGRGIASALGADFRIDRSTYKASKTDREYGLDAFQVGGLEPTLGQHWMIRLSMGRRLGRMGKLVRPCLKNWMFERVQETEIGLDVSTLSKKQNIYLQGFWQAERYFSQITTSLRSELRFKPQGGSRMRALREEIQACNSVAVHIRRGDYVTNSHYSRHYHVLDGEHYYRAALLLRKKVRVDKFFVFSDDAAWTRSQLQLDGPTYFVDQHTELRASECLELMSLCRHFIIANSTFSWWGAWLSDAFDDKVVIAPRRWLRALNAPPKGLVPQNWICI
jgi:hypothetical protein